MFSAFLYLHQQLNILTVNPPYAGVLKSFKARVGGGEDSGAIGPSEKITLGF